MPECTSTASARHSQEMEAFFRAGRIALELKSGEIILGEMTAQQIVKKAAQCDYPQSQMSRLDVLLC